jgi:hypothetical protein
MNLELSEDEATELAAHLRHALAGEHYFLAPGSIR